MNNILTTRRYGMGALKKLSAFAWDTAPLVRFSE